MVLWQQTKALPHRQKLSVTDTDISEGFVHPPFILISGSLLSGVCSRQCLSVRTGPKTQQSFPLPSHDAHLDRPHGIWCSCSHCWHIGQATSGTQSDYKFDQKIPCHLRHDSGTEPATEGTTLAQYILPAMQNKKINIQNIEDCCNINLFLV